MSKHLLIVRHAKSDWDESGVKDHDRRLNQRGKRDAPRMGQFLSDQGLIPDIILSSTAVRAKKTAELFAENCQGFGGEVQLNDELYLAHPETYLRWIRGLPDEIDVAMVVGHNPGLEDLVQYLAGHHEEMPTAAIANFSCDIVAWSFLDRGSTTELRSVWRPKEID